MRLAAARGWQLVAFCRAGGATQCWLPLLWALPGKSCPPTGRLLARAAPPPAGLTEGEQEEAAKAAEDAREAGGSDDDDDYKQAAKASAGRGAASLAACVQLHPAVNLAAPTWDVSASKRCPCSQPSAMGTVCIHTHSLTCPVRNPALFMHPLQFKDHLKRAEAVSEFAKSKTIAEQRRFLPVYGVREEMLQVGGWGATWAIAGCEEGA